MDHLPPGQLLAADLPAGMCNMQIAYQDETNQYFKTIFLYFDIPLEKI